MQTAVSVENQDGKAKKHKPWQFKPGQSGNPAGKPKGTLAKATLIAQNLTAGRIKGIVEATITAAEKGDVAAAKIIWDRIWPIPKGEAVNVTLNQLNLKGMSDVELARRMAMMMRSLLDQSSQVIDAQAQSPDQPTDADSA